MSSSGASLGGRAVKRGRWNAAGDSPGIFRLFFDSLNCKMSLLLKEWKTYCSEYGIIEADKHCSDTNYETNAVKTIIRADASM